MHSYMVAALARLTISCIMKVAIRKRRVFIQISGGYSSSRDEEDISVKVNVIVGRFTPSEKDN